MFKRRSTLSDLTRRTLGSGNMRLAVEVPEGEDTNEWIAANTVDFYNELSLLYGLVADDARRFSAPGTGFPPNFEYRWQIGSGKTVQVSSPEYVDYAMTWIEDQIDNEDIFPVSEEVDFPEDFIEFYVRDIFKKMFRIFAIIYHQHFEVIESLNAAAHINTTFKHFVFFMLEHHLVPEEKELLALKTPFDRYKAEYEESEHS
ncbi:MOB kinase activator 1A [Hondaea fermentalgiana]|uniref:MOB kinase activator 1A n=1 Tax=Hondaea fermentalgiana TaxID=2315210 RepID=A0A2R5GGJ1_9STRA|nr:MOB kinase activator 1A [Hondaea fermentalgiana]|eukprot:GBG26974.1 MOB kinase activator 1A [Hondaea fermentalgiana]